MIPIFSNTLGKQEIQAVDRVFRSRWLGKGNECAAFEDEFAAHVEQDQILLFNNCTAATFILLEALGIGPGDEVIVPSIQFVGVANAVKRCGARPIFADVDRYNLNILSHEIDRLRTKRTKAVFLLHYGGHPANWYGIEQQAEKLLLLEDSANSVASKYMGKPCGTLGDAGVWSFDAMKELVMVDGGALWLKNDRALNYAKELRYLGFPVRQTSGTDSQANGSRRWWEFQLKTASGRFISNDVLAAIGRVQLRKLPQFVQKRKRIWERYQQCFIGVPGITRPPEPIPGCESSYYLYWIQCEKRDELAQYLCSKQIYCTFRYYPLHQVEIFAHNGRALPNTDWAAEHTLNLPLHQNLDNADVGRIIDTVVKFARANL